MEIMPAASRGLSRNAWLHSRHSFSFGDYYNPRRMGFSTLRVLNEDVVAPGSGFPLHAHRDMEILSYVLEGALEHRDSLGNGSTLRPGDVQCMSAGRGIRHSEFNPDSDAPVHFLQIWLLPGKSGNEPGYAQQHFPLEGRRGKLQRVAAPSGQDHQAIAVHTDANVYASVLQAGDSVSHANPFGRAVYVQVARGDLQLNGKHLQAGDAAMLLEPETLVMGTHTQAEFLLFDLPHGG